MITIKTATTDMLKELSDNKKSVRAIAVMDNEKVLAICGLLYSLEAQTVFMKLSDEIRKRPREIIKAWKVVKEMIEERNIPTFAYCDFKIKKSENFLLHFDFIPYENDIWVRRI